MHYQKVYTFSGQVKKDNEMDVLCILCLKTENAVKGKTNSKIYLAIQAKKVKMDSEKKKFYCVLRTISCLYSWRRQGAR